MGNQPLLERIKEHEQLVAEVVRLQAEVDRQRPAALAALPASFGYLDMASFIKAVIQASRRPQQKKTQARKPQVSAMVARAKVEIGGGMAKSTRATQSVTESLRPSGGSLDDPTNFGLLPDQSLLEATGADTRIQQGKLIEALKLAHQVLHTSGVQAAIWREWRQFEHKASELLRSLNAVTRTEE